MHNLDKQKTAQIRQTLQVSRWTDEQTFMKTKNRYDILIDNLTIEFSKIKNFSLLQTDEKANSIFTFVVKRHAEISAFKTLFTNYYLPAASKSVADDINELQKSKYKHLIQITREELKENYYETVRLGYIGMFHKYESYVNDLIINAELLISDLNEKNTSLEVFLKDTFGFEIKKWHKSKNIKRINWISNSNKHFDGYPKKDYKPAEFENHPENEKLKLTKDDFVADITRLTDHYSYMLQLVLNLALYKMLCADVMDLDSIKDLEEKQKLLDKKNDLTEKMKALIALM